MSKTETTAWQNIDFQYPGIITMISEEEKKYLHWLASSFWTGEGHIIEIGPWLGGSTVCLASGMKKNTARRDKKLHVYDNFIWKEFMKKRAALPLNEGDSFQSYFLDNVAEYNDVISSYRQSLPDDSILSDIEIMVKRDINPDKSSLFRWEKQEPIEILFIDGAKSWMGLLHLLNECYDYFIPNKTLLVCQDYKYWGTYWVPLILEIFCEHLELTHNLTQNTVAFQFAKPIKNSQISSVGDFSSMSVHQGLKCLEKASNRLLVRNDTLGYAILQACKIPFLVHKGEEESAREVFKQVEALWPLRGSDHNLEVTRDWLENYLKSRIPQSFRSRLRKNINFIIRFIIRVKRFILKRFTLIFHAFTLSLPANPSKQNDLSSQNSSSQ